MFKPPITIGGFLMCSDSTKDKKQSHLIAGAIGNVLEWYDFAVFGFLAPVMSPLFFPSEDLMAGLIKTYGVFAAGYLMRPLGGILFGYIGDKLGRKKALQISISMIALPTVLVGLLPTHAQIGAVAALLLIILRLAQGVSVGGELIGSVSYLVETAPPNRRGLQGSWSLMSAVFGILLGSLVVTLIHNLVSTEQMAVWGWRVPFLLGVIIFLIGSWLRRSLVESPDFVEAGTSGEVRGNPIVSVLKEMPGQVLHLSSSLLLFSASFYTLFVWMPTYLSKVVTPPIEHAILINTIAMSSMLLLIPVAGRLSDIVGRKAVMMTAMILLCLTVYPLFLWVDDAAVMWIALIVQLLFAVMVGAIQGPVPALMVELFPAHSRNTAIGISYNVTLALFGGTSPLICTWLIHKTGDLAAPAIYLAVLGVISCISLYSLKPRQ
jgi:MHS family proline/betaine transporter-like MFS transporter